MDTIAHLSTVLGVAPAGNPPRSLKEFVTGLSLKRVTHPDITNGIGTVAGIVAGGMYYRKSRVLGTIGGASLGRNLPALLLRPEHRRLAVANMGTTGAAIVGSRLLKKWPVVGFVLGWLGGNAIATRLR